MQIENTQSHGKMETFLPTTQTPKAHSHQMHPCWNNLQLPSWHHKDPHTMFALPTTTPMFGLELEHLLTIEIITNTRRRLEMYHNKVEEKRKPSTYKLRSIPTKKKRKGISTWNIKGPSLSTHKITPQPR